MTDNDNVHLNRGSPRTTGLSGPVGDMVSEEYIDELVSRITNDPCASAEGADTMTECFSQMGEPCWESDEINCESDKDPLETDPVAGPRCEANMPVSAESADCVLVVGGDATPCGVNLSPASTGLTLSPSMTRSSTKRKRILRCSPNENNDEVNTIKRKDTRLDPQRRDSWISDDDMLEIRSAPETPSKGKKESPFKRPKIIRKPEEELKSMTIEELKDHALLSIGEIDLARKKSKNLQGAISGLMKDRLNFIRDLVACLAEKATDKGDPVFLRMEIRDLKSQLKIKEQSEKAWLLEKADKEGEINLLADKNEVLEKRLWELSRGIAPSYKNNQEEETSRDNFSLSGKREPTLRQLIDGGIPSQRLPRKVGTIDSDVMVSSRYSRSSVNPSKVKVSESVGKERETTLYPAPATDLNESNTVNRDCVRSGIETRKGGASLMEVERENSELGDIKQYVKILTNRRKEILKQQKLAELPQEEKGYKLTKGIKVIENIQLAPPFEGFSQDVKDAPGPHQEWHLVNKRRKDRYSKETTDNGFPRKGPDKSSNGRKKKAAMRKPPQTAAVAIKGRSDNISYAEILRKAREKISLNELGIENTRVRRGINGGIIIEVAGTDNKTLADSLASKLRSVLKQEEVAVSRPSARGELRISGFDNSVSEEEIKCTLAEKTGCSPEDIKIGPIKWMFNGLGSVWIQCPLETANTIAECRKIRIGWTFAKTELLPKKPLQCYRCWAFGHARHACTSSKDRSNACYFCGKEGHAVRSCTAKNPRCLVCEEKGRLFNHRLGTKACGALASPTKGKPPIGTTPRESSSNAVPSVEISERIDTPDDI